MMNIKKDKKVPNPVKTSFIILGMKLFDLFVQVHRDDQRGSFIFDQYVASSSFKGKQKELERTLPTILFHGKERPPDKTFSHFYILTLMDGTRYYGCAIIYVDNFEMYAISLVSTLPFYQTAKNVLTAMFRDLVTIPIVGPYITKQIPMPPPGRIAVSFNLHSNNFIVFRPPPNQLPIMDLPFWLPFAMFDPEQLIIIFTAILLEKRIVFASYYPAAIAPFIESLVTLIYPLQCYSTYIPFLSGELVDLMCSPLPYLLGIDMDEISLDQIEPGVMIVNIDESKLMVNADSMPTSIPTKPQHKLVKALHKMCKLFDKNDRDLYLRSPTLLDKPSRVPKLFSFRIPNSATYLPMINGLYPEMTVNHDAPDLFETFQSVRAAFLRFLVFMLMNNKQLGGEFADESKLNNKFYKEFTDTQCFQCFLDNVTKFNKNPKVDSMDKARVLFFKESIYAKKNRSNFQKKKIPTPFLTSEYWKVTRMFIVPEIPIYKTNSKPSDVIKLVDSIQDFYVSNRWTVPLNPQNLSVISSPSAWQVKFPDQPFFEKIFVKTDRTINASNKIKQNWRTYVLRKWIKEARINSIIIQKTVKMYLNKVHFKLMKKSALIIHSFARMANAKTHYHLMRKSAIKIESTFRMLVAKIHYKKMKEAAIKFESTYRMYVAKVEYKKMKKAAIKIESTYRMFVAKVEYKKMKQSAIKIESTYRMFVSKVEYKKMKKAAIKIESTFRMHQAKVHYKNMKEAAIKLQSLYRMYRAKMAFKKLRSAAIKAQSTIRMFQAKVQYKKMRIAAIKIESTWRMYRTMVHYKKMKEAAIMLQSLYRMNRAKLVFRKMKVSSVLIQSTWRMFTARNEYKSMKQAALLIESTWRMHRSRSEFKIMKSAAILIESIWRMYSDRKHYLNMKKSTVKVQSTFRMYIAAREYRNLIEEARKLIEQERLRQQEKLKSEENAEKQAEHEIHINVEQKPLIDEKTLETKKEKKHKKEIDAEPEEKKEKKHKHKDEPKEKEPEEKKERKHRHKHKEEEPETRHKHKKEMEEEQETKHKHKKEIEEEPVEKKERKHKHKNTKDKEESEPKHRHKKHDSKQKSEGSGKRNKRKLTTEEEQRRRATITKGQMEALQIFANVWKYKQQEWISQQFHIKNEENHRDIVLRMNLIMLQNLRKRTIITLARPNIFIPVLVRAQLVLSVVEQGVNSMDEFKNLKSKENRKAKAIVIKRDFDDLYKAISTMQKKVMKKKQFDNVFEYFQIPVKSKARKEKLCQYIIDNLSSNTSWDRVYPVALLVLVAKQNIPLSCFMNFIC